MGEPYNTFSGQSLERVTALADGVFAVAMTLLVLDLRVPVGEVSASSGEVLVGVGDVAQRQGPVTATALLDRLRVRGLQPAAGLTALGNVALPLELDSMSASKAQSAGMRTLDELGLADPFFRNQLSERMRHVPVLDLLLVLVGLPLAATVGG